MSCNTNNNEKKNTLNLCFNKSPLTIDPRKSGDFVSSNLIVLLFRGLTELNPNGSISLSLANSIEVSSDKKTYTFHLKNTTWSDGTKITAQDFKNSWQKVIDPAFPAYCSHLFYCIKNVEKIIKKQLPLSTAGLYVKDDNTFVVELEHPTPYFLSLVSFCAFYPYPTHNINVYSGPFILKKWHNNNEIILVKNNLYWNKNNIKLSGIHIYIITDENTAMQMYENKEIDILGSILSPFPIDSIKTLTTHNQLTFYPIGATSICAFNVEKTPLNNANLRKALSLAIDRPNIVKNICQLHEICATNLTPTIISKNREKNKIAPPQPMYDPMQAQQYFIKALSELKKTANDIHLTLSYTNSPLHKKMAETIQQSWQKLFHIKLHLEQLDEKNMFQKCHHHLCQIALRSIIAQYNDPMNFLERFKYKNQPKNFSNWQNDKFIKLLDKSYCVNTKMRKKMLQQAEKLLINEMPIAPIYHFNYAIITQPYVKNMCVGPLGDLHYDKVSLEKK
jgi:oligopeptide transport system substrate-binding protein